MEEWAECRKYETIRIVRSDRVGEVRKKEEEDTVRKTKMNGERVRERRRKKRNTEKGCKGRRRRRRKDECNRRRTEGEGVLQEESGKGTEWKEVEEREKEEEGWRSK